MSSQNILDEVFGAQPEQIETFMDAIQEAVQNDLRGMAADDVDRIRGGQPDRIQVPEQVEQVLGFVRVARGWDGSDYVWHFAPARNQRPWKVEVGRVVYAVARVMNIYIPSSVEVKIWLPYQEWDIKEVTFKAMGLRSIWNVGQQDIDRMSVQCLEVLNTLL
jgi:hypothetical protein